MKKFILFALCAVSFFTQCKKEDVLTPSELLAKGPWKVVSIVVSPGIDDGTGKIITDIFSKFENCEKDDLFIYKADGSYSFEEGATKCDPADAQIWETGKWSISADGKLLTITPKGESPTPNAIEKLDANTCQFSITQDMIENGKTITRKYTATYSH